MNRIIRGVLVLFLIGCGLVLVLGRLIPPLLTRQARIASLTNIKTHLLENDSLVMNDLFPEGAFFAYTLYGSSWINLALSSDDPELRAKAVREALWALQELERNEIVDQFSQPTQLEHGIFYQGWTNRLRGGVLLVQEEKDPSLVEAFHRHSHQIAQAFQDSPRPILSSYPGQAWPVDNLAALASLRLHDRLYGSSFTRSVVQPWVEAVHVRYMLDGSLLPHQVEPETGETLKNSRGASSTLALALLPEVDAELAQQQYGLYKVTFVDDFVFFSLAREYADGAEPKKNTNSGPVVFGYGAVASVVHMAAASANNDVIAAQRNAVLFRLLGLPTRTKGSLQYFHGRFLLYDLFVTWSTTHLSWTR